MRKYSKKAQSKIAKVMHEYKKGKLKSGKSKKRVTSRKQAIAIGISEAHERGYKTPVKKKSATSKTSKLSKKSGSNKNSTRIE